MVKYGIASRLGTADADAILKRFNRNNYQHSAYKALSELGRADLPSKMLIYGGGRTVTLMV